MFAAQAPMGTLRPATACAARKRAALAMASTHARRRPRIGSALAAFDKGVASTSSCHNVVGSHEPLHSVATRCNATMPYSRVYESLQGTDVPTVENFLIISRACSPASLSKLKMKFHLESEFCMAKS